MHWLIIIIRFQAIFNLIEISRFSIYTTHILFFSEIENWLNFICLNNRLLFVPWIIHVKIIRLNNEFLCYTTALVNLYCNWPFIHSFYYRWSLFISMAVLLIISVAYRIGAILSAIIIHIDKYWLKKKKTATTMSNSLIATASCWMCTTLWT